MKAIHKKRLMKLVEILRRDARNKKGLKFNLNTWGTLRKENTTGEDFVPEMSCGTQACALGAAAISGEFPGLTAVVPHCYTGIDFHLNGKYTSSYTVAKEVFGLSLRQYGYLFLPCNYPRRQKKTGAEGERFVANRIAKFVRDNGKIPE